MKLNKLNNSNKSDNPNNISIHPNVCSSRKQTIYWDLDDVIFNSSEVIISLINSNYRIPNNLQPKSISDLKDWSYKSIYAPITQQEVYSLFKSNQFWEKLEVRQDFLNLASSGLLSHYNNVIVTAGVPETFIKKQQLLKTTLSKLNISYDKLFCDFVGISEEHKYDKSVVDMSGGIQIDDAFFNLQDTNAKIKILMKNDLQTTFNNSFGDYRVNLDNLYEVNNFSEIWQILEFNWADMKL